METLLRVVILVVVRVSYFVMRSRAMVCFLGDGKDSTEEKVLIFQ